MSGDVQPRKRKDKKKKKDDLSIEEPRGTAATLGEGDVFMHSYHEHGTGGHWCAKIIFFSLLAVLVTLIGLIILENRGLSELEANSVESRYSGVLEGWIDDDDHHDEHTLELKHHDEDDHEEDEKDDGDEEIEVEKIEREITDDVILSAETELDKGSHEENVEDKSKEEEDQADESGEDDDFLEAVDDGDEPPVEAITAPSGAAFDEIEEEAAFVKPPDTLADEEEYEKRQEELRKEVSESSHKEGGNSVDHLWPGEPSDARWRQELDRAEEELRQEWLD